MEMRRSCCAKEKEKETTSEPLISHKPPIPEPKLVQKPPSPLEKCLKHPVACIAIAVFLLSLFTAGAWVTSGRVIQSLDAISNVLETWKSNINTGAGDGSFIPDVSPTPPTDSATNVTRKRQTSITTNGPRTDGYYTIENEGNGTTSIQKSCGNCTKIFFTKEQLQEIVQFMHSCYFEEECNVTNHRTAKGFCAMCDTVVAMSKSPLNFCIDVDSQIGSAFIRNYILYHDVLNGLYTFYNTVIKTTN